MIDVTKLSYYIFGAGRISYSLVNALQINKLNVVGVYDRNIDNAKLLAKKFSIGNFYNDLSKIDLSESSLIFLCITDSALEEFSKKIKDELNIEKKPLFVHLSAAYPSSILKSIYNSNDNIASFHIMQSFPNKDIYDIENTYAAIESDDANVLKVLKLLANKLKLKTIQLKADQKVLYHLLGVIASNYTIANLFVAREIANSIGINEKELLEILNPIIISTLKNAQKNGIINSLSGPVARNDIYTISKHQKELELFGKSYLQEYYNIFLQIQKDLLSKR